MRKSTPDPMPTDAERMAERFAEELRRSKMADAIAEAWGKTHPWSRRPRPPNPAA